jgi:Ca-activated chloride channel family protein
MVNLTTVVFDGQDRLVTDLTAEDFTVTEDGQPQAVELFARAQEPGRDEVLALDLGLLMDTSTSMLKELRFSQQAAVRFLDSIPRARELFTIFFDQDIRISRYDSENQQGLFERILDAKGSGNTALYDAVAVYLSRVQDAPGRKVLVLFTDGEDSTSTLMLSEVVQMLKASPVTVYAIGFSHGLGHGTQRHLAAAHVLRQLAALTGGAVYNPLSWRDLDGIYQKILDDLGGQYVLGYVPSNKAHDGRYRKLKVVVNGRKDLKPRHRDGYVVPVTEARAQK